MEKWSKMLCWWRCFLDTVNTAIGDKIVETLYSNRVTSETYESTPLPCPLHSKLGCFLFSKGSSNSGTTLHGGDGGGNAIFSPFEVRKTSKSPFRAKCLNSFCRRMGLWKISEWTNILPVQLVYTEPCKFCNRLQYRLLSCVNDRRNRASCVRSKIFPGSCLRGLDQIS